MKFMIMCWKKFRGRRNSAEDKIRLDKIYLLL